jgi:hypothetical protein
LTATTSLHSRMIEGLGTMQFDHYAPAPLSPEDDPQFRPAIGMRA